MARRPPDMSFTFLAKSCANSWKMSFVGQVLWNRMVIGPCWAVLAVSLPGAGAVLSAGLSDGVGGACLLSLAHATPAATVAAPTAAFLRKLRLDTVLPAEEVGVF